MRTLPRRSTMPTASAPASPNSKIRVLFLCHDGAVFGSQKSLLLMAEQLPKERYHVYVSMAKDGPLRTLLEALPGVTVLSHSRLPSAKHTRRNLLQRLGDVGALLINSGRILSLVQLIRQHRIDIVHTNSLISLEGALAAHMAGVPHVWHIREMFNAQSHRFQLTLGANITKAIVHAFSAKVLCISDYVYQQFTPYTQNTPQRYRILPNAIDLEPIPQWPPRPAKDENQPLHLLYLGRLSDGKRFQDVIDAMAILKAQWGASMPFRLQAYGHFIDPRFERHIRETLERHDLFNVVDLTPYTEDIDTCYRHQDVLLMPSSNEAFGRTVLESLLRGIPVVVPRSGPYPEIIEDRIHGFFYEPNNPRALAECLTHIYDQRMNLGRMHAACQAQVQANFDIQTQIHQLDDLYQTLLPQARLEQFSHHHEAAF